MKVVTLAGGVGAARFLQGLIEVVPPEDITAIVNVGDDAEFYGLHVSPDIDIVLYTLAGLIDEEKGWGIRGDTFACQEFLGRYGDETWFKLGDRDLAALIVRTQLLRRGQTHSQITDHLRRSLGLGLTVIPVSDDPVRTEIITPSGVLPFQEYFVRRGQRDDVLGVHFTGIDSARPAPGVLDAIDQADVILIAPSNPYVSIGTILAIAGIRPTLAARRDRVVAVTPIIGGAAVKGPAAQMLRTMGVEVSAYGVASIYQDIVGTFILDKVDAGLAQRIEALSMRVVVAPTLMKGMPEKRALAECALGAVAADAQRTGNVGEPAG